jgi:ATP-dependent Clp protease adaptor protein ClpS
LPHKTGVEVGHELEVQLDKPKKYKVIMHNDHYSTWEFVIDVLRRVFYKTEEQSVEITNSVHHNGSGLCGIYSHEIAEMKLSQVHSMAKANGYPLKCTMEEE